jgi:hypothetical protein
VPVGSKSAFEITKKFFGGRFCGCRVHPEKVVNLMIKMMSAIPE